MEQFQLAKQLIDFNKSAFENTFNMMVMFQDQSEKMFGAFMEQATWMPADGKKAVAQWVDTFKRGRDDFKKALDENFAKVDSCFGQACNK